MKKICFLVILIIVCLIEVVSSDAQENKDVALESEYEIDNAQELLEFANSVNMGNTYKGKRVRQTSDIDLEGIDWPTIGLFDSDYSFEGVYDGEGHVIKNLTVNAGGNNAFFGKLGGTVMNLGIENGVIAGTCVGAITSHSSNSTASIINCYNKALVSGARAGGIADNFNGSIVNCWTDCDLQSDSTENIGGIVSYNANSIINCYSFEEPGRSTVNIDGISYIERDKQHISEVVKRLNQQLYYSAKISGVSYGDLYFWEVTNDGSEIIFSEEKGCYKKQYLMYYILTWMQTNLSYIFVGMGLIISVIILYKTLSKDNRYLV